jgi:hypothetical protein
MTIYKRYEFSKSLFGKEIKYIARNATGAVIFMAESEKKLKLVIDKSIQEQLKQEKLAAQAAASKAKPKRALFSAKIAEPEPEPKPKSTPKPATKLTKIHDGKFISKSRLEKSEPARKKRFWG